LQLHRDGKLEAAHVRVAQTAAVYGGFCKSHAPAAMREQAGLAAKPCHARGKSSRAKAILRLGVRRRLRGKQQAPKAQRKELCACGAIARAYDADGNHLCKCCLGVVVSGRQGHLAARMELDSHVDDAVPRHGLNLHRGCQKLELVRARYAHNCLHCCANHFSEERASMKGTKALSCGLCCLHGKLSAVRPATSQHVPVVQGLLDKLLARPSFQANIRRYNAAMAFASFGEESRTTAQMSGGRGPPVYAVHGQVYHAISTLEPPDGKKRLYGQMYFYDPAEALEQRLSAFEGLDRACLEDLHKMLIYDARSEGNRSSQSRWQRAYNPYARSFMYMHELLQHGGAARVLNFKFQTGASPDPRRYNTPRAADVAVIYEGDAPPTNRVVTVFPRSTGGHMQTHKLSDLSDHVDPMTYPVLFPDGQPGWHPQLRYDPAALQSSAGHRQKVSMAEFYTHRLMTRDPAARRPMHFDVHQQIVVPWDGTHGVDTAPGPANSCKSVMPHAGGRLFQQWCVDVFTRIEGERVDWCRRNQPMLRCETLQGLADYVEGGVVHSSPGAGAHQPCPEAASVADPDFPGSAPSWSQRDFATQASASGGPHLNPHADELKSEDAPFPKCAPGRRIILPPSYSGSPRELRQCYLDAMAIVQRFGKPDLFITMTANPAWPEIVANLRPGEVAASRPDLTSRVFRLKLKALMDNLVKDGVMGRSVAFTYAVEFQKRGLPHAHILIVLQAEDKPRTPADVDQLVSAELPNPQTQPELYAAVCKHMRHGPCGPANPQCPCTDPSTKMCSRNYPRDFQETTVFNLGGYPLYRRRRLQNGEDEARTSGPPYEQTNRWIVPYNPYLLLRYDCHLNVEVCTSIKAVKYLYKYIHKGPDRANMQVGDPADEISMHLDARYVAAPEATWRIMRFSMHDKSHAVERLPVHLPRGQHIYFEEGRETEAYQQALSKPSKLEAYFLMNKERTATAGATSTGKTPPMPYQNVPLHFVWRDGAWAPRQRSGYTDRVIGRLYSAGVKEGERYYLRVLLQHVHDATCFEDLRLKRGLDLEPLEPRVHHDTFQQAALALGLLDDGALALQTLDEAVAVTASSAADLRRIFVMVLEWLPVPDAGQLWHQFREELSADHVANGLCKELAQDKALHDVRALLRERGLDVDSYSLPVPITTGTADWGTLELQRELSYDRDVEQQEFEKLLKLIQACPGQLAAWDVIQNALEGKGPNVIFIDGPAGAGKTTLYRALLHQQRAKGEIALAHAMLGIAALLLPGGRTTHSRYKLPVPLPLQDANCRVKPMSSIGRLLYRASVAIWDEAPNAPLAAFEAVDRLYKDITGVHDKPFGGKVMILGGDFRQIPPVIRRINPESMKAYTLHAASFWNSKHISKVSLHGNQRAADDKRYAEFLLSLGNGTYTGLQSSLPESLHPASVRLPDELVDHDMGKLELLSWVYPEPPQRVADEVAAASYYSGRAIVTPRNVDADELNAAMLARLSTPVAVHLSKDEVLDATAAEKDQFPEDFLNGTSVSGMPPHRLELRPGAVVMCLRNIAPDRGLCNGTRAVVIRIHRHLLELALVTPPYTGQIVFVPRVNCDSSAEGELPFCLRRRQFPLRLSWVMTINKSQGQSLKERLGVYLPCAVFAHGQTYVAYSRGGSFDTVRTVVEPEGGKQGTYSGVQEVPDGVYTLNVVDRSLLAGSAHSNMEAGLIPMLVEPLLDPLAPNQEAGDELEMQAASSSCKSAVVLPLQDWQEQSQVGGGPDADCNGVGSADGGSSVEVQVLQSGIPANVSPTLELAGCTRCGRFGHLTFDCPFFKQVL